MPRYALLLAVAALSSPAWAQPPALPGLDPATTAMARGYAQDTRTCMQHSVAAAMKAGQVSRPALMINTTARCGGTYTQFLTAHGLTPRQAQGEIARMAGEVIDAGAAGRK